MTQTAMTPEMLAFLQTNAEDLDSTVSPGVYWGQVKLSFKDANIFVTLANLQVVEVEDPTTAKVPSADITVLDRLTVSPDVGGPGKSAINYQQAKLKLNIVRIGLGIAQGTVMDVVQPFEGSWVKFRVSKQKVAATDGSGDREYTRINWVGVQATAPEQAAAAV